MKHVYCLWHRYERNGVDEEKRIGIYSTKKNAEAAQRRLSTQPGFCDYPDCFVITRDPLDRDAWEEGFFTAGLTTGNGQADK